MRQGHARIRQDMQKICQDAPRTTRIHQYTPRICQGYEKDMSVGGVQRKGVKDVVLAREG